MNICPYQPKRLYNWLMPKRKNQTGLAVCWQKEATRDFMSRSGDPLDSVNSNQPSSAPAQCLTDPHTGTRFTQCRRASWNYTWKHISQSIKLHYKKHRLGRYQFNASKGIKLKAHNSKMNGFLALGKNKTLHSVYNVSSQIHQYCIKYLHSINTLAEVLISSSHLMTYFLFFSSVPHWTKTTPLC